MPRQSEEHLARPNSTCGANLSDDGLGIIARNESWYMQSENSIRVYERHTMPASPSVSILIKVSLGSIQMCLKMSFLSRVCM